ncbi:hypothetical protein LEM8419_03549 [Neolewinella maritima]|uniref:Uncharacterized protein n=1 Tax=Neolewinella maritima TaxID=1383882 RepID=A0ABM9B6Q0_9BACT|nr:hypothetical protein [Neolewinella maritima]CAH1002677.1 hypothetical protein LEM8419_03549 [Neolewinella maritima]
MAGKATLSKLCSFTQSIYGWDVTDAEAPVPAVYHILIDAHGNPIPPTSTQYPKNESKFVGDGSGFIRSFYTDQALQPVSVGTFVVGGGFSGTTNNTSGMVIRSEYIASARLTLVFADVNRDELPQVNLSPGSLSVAWRDGQLGLSGLFAGTAADWNDGVFELASSGGADRATVNQDDTSGKWPYVKLQKRTRLSQSDPYEQLPDTSADGVDYFDLPITTPGTVRKRITGLSGELGINIIKF